MGVPYALLLIRRFFDRAGVPWPVGAILCLALALVAQPARSQEQGSMKALRVEAGYPANHEGDDVGLGGGLLRRTASPVPASAAGVGSSGC